MPRHIADFEALCAGEYTLVEPAPPIASRARFLLERYPLRAYKPVQFASTLVASEALLAAGLPVLTFLAADDRLISAAQAEGLAADDPNMHP